MSLSFLRFTQQVFGLGFLGCCCSFMLSLSVQPRLALQLTILPKPGPCQDCAWAPSHLASKNNVLFSVEQFIFLTAQVIHLDQPKHVQGGNGGTVIQTWKTANQSQQPKQSIFEGDSDLFKGPMLNVTFSVLQQQTPVGIRIFLEKFQTAGAEEVTTLQNSNFFFN